MTLPPSYEDIIELALPNGPLLFNEDNEVFTSKLGGRPVWLNNPSKDLVDSLKCLKCKTDLYLLLQMDCPREEFPAVDRVVYVFACNTRECSQDSRGWRVIFMTRRNAAAPVTGFKNEEVDGKTKTSFWDSIMSESSSVVDTKENSQSSPALKSDSKLENLISNPKNKFPGIYLHIDDEIIVEKREKKNPIVVQETAPEFSGSGIVEEEWSGEQYEKVRAPGTDKSFNRFQKRVAHYPRQCVRYAVSGGQTPLLFHDCNLSDEINKLPLCPSCKSHPTRFELQLMPAILAFLPTESAEYIGHIEKNKRSKNPMISDGMEWGTVMIYSCSAFCGFTGPEHSNNSNNEKGITEIFEGNVIIQLELLQ